MPDDKNENSSMIDSGEKLATDTAKAMGTVKNAAKAAAKAGVGDIAGAVVTVLKDENIRKAIIAILLCISLITMCTAMLVGSAITGTVEKLSESLSDHWDDAWEEQALISDGNAIYLYTIGAVNAGVDAVVGAIESLFTNEDPNELPPNEQTKITDDTYRTYLDSIIQESSLTGENGSLRKCLDMIKGRVAQRGEQIKRDATSSYKLEAIGNSIGVILQERIGIGAGEGLENLFLYNGIASASINVDTSAFNLTDLQALKILAAYSIQHDCLLSEVDIWDLMDYCGWYGTDSETLDTSVLGEQSIYNGTASGIFTDDIAGITQPGESLGSYSIYLAPPQVTKWSGNFTPQWYNEELAQAKAHNKEYDRITANGAAAPEGMIRYAETEDGEIDPNNFAKLSEVQPFGLIDKIYTSANASLTVSRQEYTGAGEHLDEALATFTGIILDAWTNAAPSIGAQESVTSAGVVRRSAEGSHSYTATATQAGCSYYLQNTSTGAQTGSWQSCTAQNQSLTWNNLDPSTTYSLVKVTQTEVPDETGGAESTAPTTPGAPPAEMDTLSLRLDLLVAAPNSAPAVVALATETSYDVVDTFSTFQATKDYQAFELVLEMNVTYTSVSVDQLLSNIMGLWPGSLYDRTKDLDGTEYAQSQLGNELLVYKWEDTYTDPDTGETQVLEFQRQQGYQTDAYKDIILGIADTLGISTAGLFDSPTGYGRSIVQMAKKELAYYEANNLSGGMRYWDMARAAGGTTINYNAPWCVCFVLTCAYQCGYIGPGQCWGDFDGGDWILYVTGIYDYLSGGYGVGHESASENYLPSPGDLICFNTTVSSRGLDHIGIVTDVSDTGVVTYIDGNSGGGPGYLRQHTASNYALGTPAYTGAVIACYIHPNYPASYFDEPVYISIPGSVQPFPDAKTLTLNDQNLSLFGIGRLRESQLQDAVNTLKRDFPELYIEDLQTALDDGDMTAFASAWNQMISGSKEQSALHAQHTIRNQRATTISQQVFVRTGFDWRRTDYRENLLWGIITTSDQDEALVETLSLLCAGLDNNTADKQFLDAMNELNGSYSKAYQTLYDKKDNLWPDDNSAYQDAWLKSIHLLLEELTSIYDATAGSIGDPNAPVEEQIFFYLTHSMGLPTSSACGILANIQHESNFNSNAVGDNGTSYGLCQWHNSRYTALINYCNSIGVDYRSVEGQMRYLQYELENNYASLLGALRSMPNTANGAYNAGAKWCTDFERPANASAKSVSRGNLASGTYWPRYNGT